MNEPITYRPWIPKAGKADTFAAMKRAYGKPEDWPDDLRAVVAERGAALPFVVDPNCTTAYYGVSHEHLRIITESRGNYWKYRC